MGALVVRAQNTFPLNQKTFTFSLLGLQKQKSVRLLYGWHPNLFVLFLQTFVSDYYMVNFVKPNLLGTFREFSNRFVNPITNGQYDDSTTNDHAKMKRRCHVLHKLLDNTVQRFEVTTLQEYVLPRYDHVVFIRLHPVQEQLYKAYVELVRGKRGLFGHYRIIQNICCHPYMLKLYENGVGLICIY